MQSITLFEFPETNQEVGVVTDPSGRPWFRATNVCAVLEFANPARTLEQVCPQMSKEYKVGMGRPANYVSLPGCFRLMFASKAPVAERFRDWVCDEVLVQVFTNGSYQLDEEKADKWSEVISLAKRAKEAGLAPAEVVELHHQINGIAPAPVVQAPARVRTDKPKSEPILQWTAEIAAVVRSGKPVTVPDVLSRIGLDPTIKANQMAAASSLKQLGWKASKRRIDGKVQRIWEH